MKHTALLLIIAASPAVAATLVFDDFSGASGDNVNGTSPDTNLLTSGTWQASTEISPGYLRADGSAVDAAGDSNNVDRGAFLDLGSGFFVGGETYTLTLDFGQLNSSAIFAGFTNQASPSLTSTAQIEGSANLAIRARDFGSNDALAIWNRVGTTNNVTGVDTGTNAFDGASYVVTMTIDTNSLTDADVEVSDGTSTNSISGVDVSGMRWLYLGYEDANITDAQDLMADVNSITLTGVPEPSVALLGALGLFGLLRRRR